MADKFDPETSYYKHHTQEVCGLCRRPLTHPPIMLPAGPAYVKLDKDNVQSESPLLEFPHIKLCYEDACRLLAPLDYDPNHPDEGKWWREWQNGKLEPVGLTDEEKTEKKEDES